MLRFLIRTIATVVILISLFVGYVVYVNRPLPPQPSDIRVLERTLELLNDPTAWSKEDDRSCNDDSRMTLYCALKRASIDVTGEFKHRAASLQEVRHAIENLHPDKDYAHRLQDFNNDPDVTLDDLRGVVLKAMEALRPAT